MAGPCRLTKQIHIKRLTSSAIRTKITSVAAAFVAVTYFSLLEV